MKKFLSCTAAALLMVSLCAGCGTAKKTDKTTTSTTVNDVTTTTQASSYQANMLTGKLDIPTGADTRAVGVMICNDSQTKLQPGIDKADMYMECETEAGIVRMMAIFPNADSVPSELGPVRSARTPFVKVARALGLVYLHAGGSPGALSMVKASDVHDVNVLTTSGITFRDSSRGNAQCKNILNLEKANGGWDHCLVTSGSRISTYLNKNFKSISNHTMPFAFGDKKGDQTATSVDVYASANSSGRSYFSYDAGTGLYTKYKGTAASHTTHKSADGNALTVNNIILLYAKKGLDSQQDNQKRINFNLEAGGSGKLISGGTARDINYSYSTSSLQIKETTGAQATVASGKTYIYVISTEYASQSAIH